MIFLSKAFFRISPHLNGLLSRNKQHSKLLDTNVHHHKNSIFFPLNQLHFLVQIRFHHDKMGEMLQQFLSCHNHQWQLSGIPSAQLSVIDRENVSKDDIEGIITKLI